MPTIAVFTGFEFGTATGAGAGPFDGITGTAGTDVNVVAGTPVVGSYVGQISTLNNRNFFWNTNSLGTGKTALVVSLRFMFTTLPTSANDFHSIDVAASSDRAGFYFDPADQKVHAWITSATQAASSTIVANTWYTLQFRYDCSASINTLDWTFNGVSQTQVTNNLGATTIARYALGNRGGASGVVEFDDVAVSVTGADYPLPMYQVRMVGVDTAASTTQIGTADATVRFTANGTLDGTHNSTAILTALSERPPLLGASSSGVAQQTAGSGNAVEIPMATYTLAGGETIAGCRLYLAGWAASALGANLGMRAWNGTAETILHGDTAATGFDSTSNGAWYAYMYSGVTSQATLDALTVRIGYSTDVSPVVGAHAVYAEILILPGAGGATLADLAGGGGATGGGTETISAQLADLAGGGAAGGGSTEGTGVGLATPAVGAAAGGGTETSAAVLATAPGGGAAAGGTQELPASSLLDVVGDAVGGGRTEMITAALADAPMIGGVAGGIVEAATAALADLAGGGAAGGGPELLAAALADAAGGGATLGATVEASTAGGGPAFLADLAGGGAAAGATAETDTSDQVVHDVMVMPLLTWALQCLQTQANRAPAVPAYFQLRPGNSFIAGIDNEIDECCAGIAWVRCGPMSPTDNFPYPKTEVGNGVETDYAVQVEIGIQRCSPLVSDGFGHIPTAEQWAAAAQQEEDDKATLRRTACCIRDTYTGSNGRPLGKDGLIIGSIEPLAAQGACGGVSVIVTARVPACDCVGL